MISITVTFIFNNFSFFFKLSDIYLILASLCSNFVSEIYPLSLLFFMTKSNLLDWVIHYLKIPGEFCASYFLEVSGLCVYHLLI